MSERDSGRAERSAEPTNRRTELKRSAGKRKRFNKKRIVLAVVIISVIVISALAVALLAFVFKAKNITVTNDTGFYTNEEILAAAGIEQNKGFLSIWPGICEKKVEQYLPYVGDLEVKRKLPDTVEVTVNYTSEVFAVKTGDNYVLLNEDGKVLKTEATDRGIAAVVEGISFSSVVIGKNAIFADIERETEIATDNTIEKETEAAETEPDVLMTGSEIFEALKTLAVEMSENELGSVSRYSITQSKSGKVNVKVVLDDMIEIDFGVLSSSSSKVRLAKKIVDENSQKASAENKLCIDLTDGKTGYVRSQNAIDKVEEDVSNAAAAKEAATGETEAETEEQ
jgi:hypothetical protein